MDRKWWTLIAVCVGTFMLLLDVTIVNVALPAIQRSLKASFSDLQWVVDAYALMLAALLLTTGALADKFGRRIVFAIGLALFSAASLLCGLATSPLFLNLARGAQGIGGATMFATSLALLAQAFRGRDRGTAFGAWGAVTGIAVAIGPVLGGVITSGLSWRWIFFVNVPIGIAAIVLTMLRVVESRDPNPRRVDYVGLITFSGALGLLVYALIKSDTSGWGSTLTVSCLAAAAALLAAFVIAEFVQRAPMFDLSLFRKPTFVGGSIAAFSLSAALFSLLLYLTLYLQNVLGYSALQTGVRLVVISGGILLTSTLAGRLTVYVPIRLLIAPGLALVGAGLLLMRGLDSSSGWTHLIPGFIVAGAGAGLINPPLASTAVGVVAPARAGMASGINTTFRQVGIATGIAALGSIFQHTVRTTVVAGLHGAPGLSPAGTQTLAGAVARAGGASASLTGAPATARPALFHAIRAGFASGLNDVLLIGAFIAFVAAVLTLVLIRGKDFHTDAARSGGGGGARSDVAPNAAAPAKAASATSAAPPPATPAEAASGGRSGAASPASRPMRSNGQSASSQTGVIFTGAAEAVALAAELAAIDYGNQIEQAIHEHQSRITAAADAEAQRLRSEAAARGAADAAELRSQLDSLADERIRLVEQLREDSRAFPERAEHAAQTRRALYSVIRALGDVADQTSGNLAPQAPEPPLRWRGEPDERP